MIHFTITKHSACALLEYNLDGAISPDILKTLQPPDPVKNNFAHKGIILSGKGPVWLYGFLVHFYHPTKFVAIFDPRLDGAVVVETHGSEWQAGDVIPAELWKNKNE